MDNSSSTTHINDCYSIKKKRKEKTRGATMMAKITKIHNTCVRLSIELDHKIETFMVIIIPYLGVIRYTLVVEK